LNVRVISMRILILIAIGLLLYIIINNLLGKKQSEKSTPITEQMVKCEHCGLHILQHEAIEKEHHFYCSQEHVEADRQSKK